VARGRPGVGLTVVQHAAEMCEGRRLPAPAAAYLEAGIKRASERPAANSHLGVGH
jgi:hypothetical protein